MAVTLTLAANARSSVPTEHPGKISSGPTTLFGVPGITGHTICRTLDVGPKFVAIIGSLPTSENG